MCGKRNKTEGNVGSKKMNKNRHPVGEFAIESQHENNKLIIFNGKRWIVILPPLTRRRIIIRG